MHEHTGPFLSATAIRRILSLHSFSEVNHAYLAHEADQRERWEQEVQALLRNVLSTPDEVTSPPAFPRETAGVDVSHSIS